MVLCVLSLLVQLIRDVELPRWFVYAFLAIWVSGLLVLYHLFLRRRRDWARWTLVFWTFPFGMLLAFPPVTDFLESGGTRPREG